MHLGATAATPETAIVSSSRLVCDGLEEDTDVVAL
jgi:hypothetical protein